ncbi:hypothetical protein HAX54_016580, partial [Datura stramonium]|nr:hypothetical protein [Datura stramonium]
RRGHKLSLWGRSVAAPKVRGNELGLTLGVRRNELGLALGKVHGNDLLLLE